MNKKYLGLLAICSVSVAFALTTGTILPTGIGVYSAWVPSTGTTHYTLVDESSCNGATDYVTTSTVGARDSYTVSLSGVPDGSTVTGISITPCASKSTSNKVANMSVFYRMNGVDSTDSATYTLSGVTPTVLTATNYTGLSVTKNASTTLEVGAVLASGATTGARLSHIATVVTYTVPAPNAPSNLSVTAITAGTTTYAQLNWTDNSSNELSFLLEKGTDGINFTQFASTTANTVSRNDFAVTSGNTYYYRIRAYNAGGFSAYASTTSVTMP